jgi:hypothetical protein
MGSRTVVLNVWLNTGRLLSKVAYSSMMYPQRWFRQTAWDVLLINAIQFKVRYTSKLLKEEEFYKRKIFLSFQQQDIIRTDVWIYCLYNCLNNIIIDLHCLCILVKTFIALFFKVFYFSFECCIFKTVLSPLHLRAMSFTVSIIIPV